MSGKPFSVLLRCCLVSIVLLHASPGLADVPESADKLAAGWDNPPDSAKVRAYWWWLNGNVTKEAITRDLEEMRSKGFGGALICDAGGAEQDGNDPVPHGPTFFTPEWRELYRHALHEAARLGLELSLSIQSGWNLGGPTVKAEDAAKKLVWSEATTTGPGAVSVSLAEPAHKDPFYRDIAVVAYRLKRAADGPAVSASSARTDLPARLVADGKSETFWSSGGVKPGEGPTRSHPEWLQVAFPQPTKADALTITPRPGYGPKECEVQVSDNGSSFRTVQAFVANENGPTVVKFAAVTAKIFRVVMFGAFDPRSAGNPRQVQVAEVGLAGAELTQVAARPIESWEEKAVHKTLHFSTPDTTPLLRDVEPIAGEEETRSADVVDVTAKLGNGGVVTWDAPAGTWKLIRFGYTVGNNAKVSTASEGWNGYALDVLDEPAFKRYWTSVVDPLIADAGPLAGKTLKYLTTDSWEVEAINWTPTFREEFRGRRGYDMLPYTPVLAGHIVDSREISNRFLHDFRKTIGDLAIAHHYQPYREWAHAKGLEIHPEAGGPHAVPIDAQRCLGWTDLPMSEFWAESWRHRIGDPNRFFVKQPASAAHTYGHPLVAAEGFTTIGPHWQETLWDNLKPSFDKACTEGLNRLVWHAFVCSPASMGVPGQQYFAGTHVNPNVTWWSRGGPFLTYLNRCQWMLQQGLPAADVLYYYGDHVPNFAQLRQSDPAKLGRGFDYDVVTEEALLSRVSVREGRLVLPEGTSYRALVLPPQKAMSYSVIKKVGELLSAGALIIGPKPEKPTGLTGYPAIDREFAALSTRLWDTNTASRVIADSGARDVLLARGIKPDFEFTGGDEKTDVSWIHRVDGAADVYFVASRAKREEHVKATFRVSGKRAELWDAVTGARRVAPETREADGLTTLPLDLEPCGSVFVVFRQANGVAPSEKLPSPQLTQEIGGPWTVTFDPKSGGPGEVKFDKLVDWTSRPEPGIKFYSGTATYRCTFDLPGARQTGQTWLDLGRVRELAEVRLNGKSLGIVWAPPFRMNVTPALKATNNVLEIDVVNFWPNRIIGDAALPKEERLTRTNIRKLTAQTALMESGLFGPVQVLQSQP